MFVGAQPIECLAAIAWEASKPLDVTTVIVDPPKKGEVRIRVRMLRFCCNTGMDVGRPAALHMGGTRTST